jgi:deazaflavin-dependent oxidoreductase (nitroreductase family)
VPQGVAEIDWSQEVSDMAHATTVGPTARVHGGAGRRTGRWPPRWLAPQDYSADRDYRAPSRHYARLSRWIGVPLTSLGLAPRHAVTLEVVGRRSGRPRRNPVLVTSHEGVDHLVSLAGESDWVRNVRAAGGRAVLHRRGPRPVRLVEVPLTERAPVLAAYQAAGAARSGEAGARVQARANFGLETAPTEADFRRLAPRYPVFRVLDVPEGVGSGVWSGWARGWWGVVVLAVVNGGVHRAYEPALGVLPAEQVSNATLLAVVVPWAFVVDRRHPTSSVREALAVGALWGALTVVFELLVGHYVNGDSWQTLIGAYDLAAGHLWPLAVAGIVLAPTVARSARRRPRRGRGRGAPRGGDERLWSPVEGPGHGGPEGRRQEGP